MLIAPSGAEVGPMAATPPAADRTRRVARLTRTGRQPPRRLHRRVRLLASGVSLVMVATLVPRALADDGDTEISLETFRAPEAVDASGDADILGGASLQGGEDTDTGDLAAGELQPQTPGAEAEHRTEGRQPGDTISGDAAGSSDQDTGARRRPGPAWQDDQLLADADGCAGEGCSTEPDLIAAAAGGGASGGRSRLMDLVDRLLRAVRLRSPQESALEYPQPRRLEPIYRDVLWDLNVVEHLQETRERQGLNLDQEEQYDAEIRLARAFEGIRQWRSEVAEGTPAYEQLLRLTLRAERAAHQLLTVTEPRPGGRPTQMDLVEWNLRAVELLQEAREVEGVTRGPEELRDDQFRLARAFEGIRQLQPQVAEGPESERERLADLTRRVQQAQRQLTQEVQRGSPMSSVQLPPPLTPANEQAPNVDIAMTHPGASLAAEQPRTGPPVSDATLRPVPPPPPFGGSKPDHGIPALEVTQGMPPRLEAAMNAAVQTGKATTGAVEPIPPQTAPPGWGPWLRATLFAGGGATLATAAIVFGPKVLAFLGGTAACGGNPACGLVASAVVP
jgi:hypothetical protein